MRLSKFLSILMALAILSAGVLPVAAQGKGGGGKGGGGSKASAKSASKQSVKAAKKSDDRANDAGKQKRAKKEKDFYPVPPPKAKPAAKVPIAVKPPVTTPPSAKGPTLPSTKAPPAVTPKPLGPIKPPPGVVNPGPNYPLHPAHPWAKYPLHGHRFWKHHPWIYGGGGSSSILNLYGDVEVGCFDVGCAQCGCEIVAVIDESRDTLVDPSVQPLRPGDLVVVHCPGDDQDKVIRFAR